MKFNFIKDAIILCIITCIAGLLLAIVNDQTKDIISDQNKQNTINSYQAVLAEADSFKNTKELTKLVETSEQLIHDSNIDFGKNGIKINDALIAYQNNTPIGYILDVSSFDGYGGEIELTIGINEKSQISGIEILSIDETVGLGMNAKEDSFKNQYLNKNTASFIVSKQATNKDNEIDALSGATFTSKAFTNAVNGALYFYQVSIQGGK